MIRRTAAFAAVASLALIGPGALIAAAQEIESGDTSVAPEASLTLTAWSIYVIVSALLPLLVGLVTKYNAPTTLKLIVNAFCAAVVGLITTGTQSDGTALISLTSFKYAAVAFAISVIGYLGVYGPLDTNAKLAPDTGLGAGGGDV